MKIKAWIYFVLVITGVIILSTGEQFMPEEYALSLGFILLMFGLYKVSVSWNRGKEDEEQIDKGD